MTNPQLRSLGWNEYFQHQLLGESENHLVAARVTAHFGSQLLLIGEAGEFQIAVQLADSVGDIAIGDWLLLEREGHRATRRLERQSYLCRKAAGQAIKPQAIAANIDTIFIVSSCNEDFNLSRIERYLALILQSGAAPVVVLTKSDLSDDAAALQRSAERLMDGLLVECIDARHSDQVAVLLEWCGPGQSVALLGSSGVGKSTLANSLGAMGLATAAIREKDGKGRHTTTARSLHLLPSGGVLVDNPGIRELQLPGCEEGVKDVFEDVVRLADHCRFRDCSHGDDAGCAVVAAVDAGVLEARRYHNFLKLLAEQARNARTLAERRGDDRKMGRFYKSVIKEKRRRMEGL